MNIFRTKINEELANKVEAFESQLKTLEVEYQALFESNKDLSEKLIELTSKLIATEEVVEEQEEKIEQLEEVVEEKQEMIEEVIENTVSVEKLAAIKALEILADCGVEVVETIDSPEDIDLMAQMSKLKGASLVEFYKNNRAEIVKNYNK
jgi:chromosome segregation ATPase